MATHTPAPWAIDDILANGHCKVRGPDGLVAVVGNGERTPETFKANALLTAAAPVMLKKLKSCVSALNYCLAGMSEDDPLIIKVRATRDGAVAAISEALGVAA